MKNFKIFNLNILWVLLISVLLMGCKTPFEKDNPSAVNESNDGTFAVSFNVYDAVLAAQAAAGRSILPNVSSDSLYFSVIAQNAETSPTDTVYYACDFAGVPDTDAEKITLNLKATNYWYIKFLEL